MEHTNMIHAVPLFYDTRFYEYHTTVLLRPCALGLLTRYMYQFIIILWHTSVDVPRIGCCTVVPSIRLMVAFYSICRYRYLYMFFCFQ